MKGRAAYSSITVFLLIASLIIDAWGLLWIFGGISESLAEDVFRGLLVVIVGFGIGAVANFLK